MRLLQVLLLFLATKSFALPLQDITAFCAANQAQCKKGTQSLLSARGIGTDIYYVLEVDPVTGQIPVEAAFSLAADYDWGPVGPDTLRTAAQIGNENGAADFGAGNSTAQTLRVITSNDSAVEANLALSGSPVADVNPVPIEPGTGVTFEISNLPVTADTNLGAPGASTIRTASMLGVGSTAVSAANPVPITPGTGATFTVSNLPTTVDTNLGTPGASTVRTAAMLGVGSTAVSNANPVPVTALSSAGKAYSTSVRNVYSSVNVTTGAWVQLIASTPVAITAITIFDSSGQTLELGTGAAASETRVMIIPPGGIDGQMSLTIASGTRVSIRAISATANSGEIDITGYN